MTIYVNVSRKMLRPTSVLDSFFKKFLSDYCNQNIYVQLLR